MSSAKKLNGEKYDGCALMRWMIRSIDGNAYRAGRLRGMKHPAVDSDMIEAAGGLTALLTQAEALERQGLLQADWRSLRGDIRRIEYPVSVMPELCRRAGVEDPRKRQLRFIKRTESLLEEMRGTFLEGYYRELLARLEDGKEVKEPDPEDELFFHCLNACAVHEHWEWKRVFSARVLGDSKMFEKEYERSVLTVLRKRSPLYEEGMTDDELLGAHGIQTYSQTLEWKGPLVYGIEKADGGMEVIDSSANIYGTVINAQTLEHALPVSAGGVRKIVLIENKANYESMDYRADTLYIFCHGFFAPKELRFLGRVAEIAGEGVEYLHWGDMDLGGIRIFLYNQKKLFPGLKPRYMDAETYEAALAAGAGLPVEQSKMEKLAVLEAGALQELKECIMKHGMEIEQERLMIGLQHYEGKCLTK